jgi:twitching motility protein PilJ
MAFKSPAIGFLNKTRKEEVAVTQTVASDNTFHIPWLGRQSFDRQLVVLTSLLLIFLIITAIAAFLDKRDATYGTRYVAMSSKLSMLSQRLAKETAASFTGDAQAFDRLETTRAEFSAIVNVLHKGGDNLPATEGKPRELLDKLFTLWVRTGGDLDALAKSASLMKTLKKAAADETDLLKLSAQLTEESQGLQKERADRLARLIERIAGSVQLVLASSSAKELSSFVEKTTAAQNLLNEMPVGDPNVQALKAKFEGYQLVLGFISANAADVLTSHQGGLRILQENDQLLAVVQGLVSSYEQSSSDRVVSLVMWLSGGMVMLLLLLLSNVYLAESHRREQEAARSNSANQAAILRLMNELADLADGDLTVKATVTGDITGAIADSVNHTTDELRKLVVGVSAASQEVARATSEAGAVTAGLSEAAQRQAAQIREAGSAVELMGKSIQEVDSSATQSAEVARRTLAVTEQGARAVENTIAGMDGIREQIQETSKRIKRLGESSQEIGEIVDLISDITEQTNVLALNAAIQAASAGEAGRGFSVVAEEVQRLAERSAAATKQIGSLVKTIQADTQNAVVAMEKSTRGVVDGAKLSDAAGQSLREIEKSTRELADLVNSISVSTQVQTDMASEVGLAMEDILKITVQTTSGTQLTNASVALLEKLAQELNNSVSGFKL